MAKLEQLVEELVKECKTQDDFKQLLKALKQRGLEAALSGELADLMALMRKSYHYTLAV